jgi:hypothetical protein
VLAAASGLYLYQAKHRAHQLDRQIEATAHAAEAARDRIGILRAEWQLLNDPERLAQLSDRFLSLKTTTPGQFTTLADLDSHLPPVRAPEPPAGAGGTDEPAAGDTPIAQAPAAPSGMSATAAEAAHAPPQRPAVSIAAAHPPERTPRRPSIAEARAEPRPDIAREPRPETRVETRPVVMSAIAPLAPPRPIGRTPEFGAPASAPRPAPMVPVTPIGSALGMARTALPPPVPVPAAFNPALQPGGN